VADKFGRPEWDDYFMSIAILATTRSIDPNTKHGCCLVDDKHHILSVGYNGPLRNAIDENVPLEAPAKYEALEHAERNSVYNAKVSLEGSTAFITGFPCIDCFRALVQSGVKRIVYGPIISSKFSEGRRDTVKEMLIGQDVSFEEYKGNFWEVFEIMEDYLATKNIVHPYANLHKKS